MLKSTEEVIVSRNEFLIHGFQKYIHFYLRKHFHGIYLMGEFPQLQNKSNLPLLICMNHSSWWDLLIGMWLAEKMPEWTHYGVMDSVQLERYSIFKKMGVLGADKTSREGVRNFLKNAKNLLLPGSRALWITPQGEICSSRKRPIVLQSGLGHLMNGLGSCEIICVSVHYEFRTERLPDIFISISDPYTHLESDIPAKRATQMIATRMESQLDELQNAAMCIEDFKFTKLLAGGAGTTPIYDIYRKIAARVQGKTYQPEHDAATIKPITSNDYEPD